MSRVTFAEQLRAAMGSMTQEQLSAASGVSQSTISALLNDATKPRYTTLEALENALPELRRLRSAA